MRMGRCAIDFVGMWMRFNKEMLPKRLSGTYAEFSVCDCVKLECLLHASSPKVLKVAVPEVHLPHRQSSERNPCTRSEV